MSNYLHIKHQEIMNRHASKERWSEQLVNDEIHKGVWISAPPGTPPDPHIHPDFNEWWVVLDGKTKWQIGQYEAVVGEWGQCSADCDGGSTERTRKIEQLPLHGGKPCEGGYRMGPRSIFVNHIVSILDSESVSFWTSENGGQFVLLGSSGGREGKGFDWLIKFPETELLTEENFSYLFS